MTYPKKIYLLTMCNNVYLSLDDLMQDISSEEEEVVIYAPIQDANVHNKTTPVFTDVGDLPRKK